MKYYDFEKAGSYLILLCQTHISPNSNVSTWNKKATQTLRSLRYYFSIKEDFFFLF